MSRKLEIELEKKICEKVVDCLLDAGYSVGVYDGAQIVVENCADKRKIMRAVFSTDEDIIMAYKGGKRVGWVRLIWGNVQDLISDYSTNLDEVLKDALDFARSYD